MEEIFRALDKFKKEEITVKQYKNFINALNLEIKNT